MTDSGLSIRAYADHRRHLGLRGGTPWAVQKALKDGRITKNEHGKIDPVQADVDWETQTSPARQTTPIADEMPSGQGSKLDFSQARAVRELYAARIARLDFEQRNGTLVSVDQMKLEIFRKARQVRDRMLAIPGRIDAQLAAETDRRTVRKILDGEIRKALEALGHE